MNRNAVGVRSRGEGVEWLLFMRGLPIAAIQHVRAASAWAGCTIGIDTIVSLGWSSALDGWVRWREVASVRVRRRGHLTSWFDVHGMAGREWARWRRIGSFGCRPIHGT